MDVSITATKHQTLASALPLSPQFHLPAPIRREFLGCGTRLRPPGLRSRRAGMRRLGFRIRPPKCLFSESMDQSSVAMVAAAAAAAVATVVTFQLIYMDYSRRRRDDPKIADKQPLEGTVNSEFCQQDEDILEKEAVRSQILSREPFERECAFEGKPENICHKEVQDYQVNVANLVELQASLLSFEEICDNEVRPGYELLPDEPTGDELFKANEFKALTSSVAGDEVKTVAGDGFADNIPGCSSGEEEDIAFPSAPIEPNIIFSAMNTEKKTSSNNLNGRELEHIATKHNEDLFSTYNAHLREPGKEISNFNEEKQLAVRSASRFESLSTKPRHLSFQNNTVSSSHLRTALEDVQVIMKSSPLIAEGQAHIGCIKESPMSNENDLMKVDGFRRNIGRTHMPKNSTGDFSVSPKQNGFARDVYGPTAYYRTYSQLLKDGRLRDCMDLLERMERKGLLDMDKVHHTKFLKACKSQKAVKEAFQFCKLIQKPTLSTFNMLLSVCASSQDFDGAFQVMLLVKEAGLKPDCKLYTTLISTCAKSGKVDAMFEVFHEMVNAGVEPNVNTYGALIDGCARAGQVAKAFGAYGIMSSKKVQPDRVIFNALITACGQSGAVDRAFDVLAEMRAEPKPIDPDHVTIGALMKTCTQAGQVDRVREVYKMLRTYNIRGTPDVYTIAVKSCSLTGDLGFALSIYDDMKKNGVVADEMFLSTIMDVAGHAQKVDIAFDILQDAKKNGIRLGNVSYSSLMGACCNAKNWQKALELYEEIKAIKLQPTVSTLNALITALCDGDQLKKSVEVLDEIKNAGVQPNIVTYSILIVACKKKDDAELGFILLSKAKKDGIRPNLIMCRCLTGLCLKTLEKAYSLGEPIVTFNSGKPQIDSKWASLAIMVYRETISAGVIPTIEVFSQVLGCLQFPRDSSLRNRFVENLGITIDVSRWSNICSLLDGFGEYDTRCFSVLEEAVSLGVIPRVSFKDTPIVIDARKLLIHTVEVYLLTILKGLKHRLAAGARLPNVTILLPIEKTQVEFSNKEKAINVAGRIGQAVGSLLRRLGIPYSGDESYGKIRINGLTLRRWFKPKVTPPVFGRPADMIPVPTRLAKGISDQQRNIRNFNNLS